MAGSESEESSQSFDEDQVDGRSTPLADLAGSYPMPPPPPRLPRAPELTRDDQSEEEDAASTTSTRSAPSRGRKRGGGGDEPDNDYDAYQLLIQKEYCNIANLGEGRLAVYNDNEEDRFGFGKWSLDEGALDRLCVRNADSLGKFYGKQNNGVKRLIDKAKRYGEKPSMWHLNFDAQLGIGELPLFDGILNTVTHRFTPYSSDKMCTTKMLMTTEEYLQECTAADIAEVQRILRQMFPETALYNNALSRIALAIQAHRNFHREILILYGDGANGKTVLIKMLRMTFGELIATMSMNNLKETPDSAGDKPMS
jgi:hypothetical protein